MKPKNQSTWWISSFYHFKKLTNLDQIQKQLEDAADAEKMVGLVILGAEGLNSTFACSTSESRERFKSFLQEVLGEKDLKFKDSKADFSPFRLFKVKQREEIVTLGAKELFPSDLNHRHLSPEEWNKVLKEESDFLLLDTRNWYEVKIGTFKGAIDPQIEQFTEFPEWVEQQNYPKDKKMLIFCTGGIRCEKGLLELEQRGYKNVYQLDGGILNYIEQHPRDQFEGECFVFDNRVAVDQDLQPSQQFKLCPHCGQPAFESIKCARCGTETKICCDCHKLKTKQETCSKNCAHWWALHPGKPGLRQIPIYQR